MSKITNFKNIGFVIMLCLGFGLTACGGGAPSEKAVKKFYQEKLSADISAAMAPMASMVSADKQMTATIDELKVIDEIKSDDGSWRIIAETTTTIKNIPFQSDQTATGKLEITFKKGKDGWYVLDATEL